MDIPPGTASRSRFRQRRYSVYDLTYENITSLSLTLRIYSLLDWFRAIYKMIPYVRMHFSDTMKLAPAAFIAYMVTTIWQGIYFAINLYWLSTLFERFHKWNTVPRGVPVSRYFLGYLRSDQRREFIFQLYNFVSAAKADDDNFEAPSLPRLASAKESVDKNGYKTVPGGRKRKRGATDNSSDTSRHGSSSGAVQDSDSFGNPSVQEDLVTAGYTLSVMISDEVTPLTPLRPTMHRATSQSNVSVVLKIIHDSHERRLLEYLIDIKAPLNHTIPLLEVIDLSIGKAFVVLHWKTPLDEVLRFGERPDDVEFLCTQFIEGVAFLHQHKVAHCDIKPGNVVVDTELESKTSPRLYIIDFDIAQFVESEETMTEGWCGTSSWTAPELGSRIGPIKRYSPILADRFNPRARQPLNPGEAGNLVARVPEGIASERNRRERPTCA